MDVSNYFDEDEMPDLGACCNCGIEGRTVRNVILIDRLSPEPGYGCWGCLVCDLPQAGATAVLCDRCLEESQGNPKTACLGPPVENRRIPIQQLTIRFEHDMSKHKEGKIEEGNIGGGAEMKIAWPDPTPSMLDTPEFNAVWNCIKTWDIAVPEAYGGYCGANGSHVRAILDALEEMRRGGHT